MAEAYREFYFTDVFWPTFRMVDFLHGRARVPAASASLRAMSSGRAPGQCSSDARAEDSSDGIYGVAGGDQVSLQHRIPIMKPKTACFNVIGQLGSLRRYAQSLTRDSADAEDLVHDALVRAYERRGTFRSGGNLRAWLLSIVHNAFVDRVRSRRSEAARIEQAGYLADASTPAPQEHSVRLAQVRQAFFTLPEEQRSALIWSPSKGFPTASRRPPALPLGTLMSRIGRARAALRQMEDARPPARDENHLRIVGGERYRPLQSTQ